MESATEILRKRMKELAMEQINQEKIISVQTDTYSPIQTFNKKNTKIRKRLIFELNLYLKLNIWCDQCIYQIFKWTLIKLWYLINFNLRNY